MPQDALEVEHGFDEAGESDMAGATATANEVPPARTGKTAVLSTLVLGATGGFGAAMTLELLGKGKPVRLLARDLDRARVRFGNRANAEYHTADAAETGALNRAVAGCGTVIVALNLGGQDQIEQVRRVLAAWKRSQAAGTARVTDAKTTAKPTMTIVVPVRLCEGLCSSIATALRGDVEQAGARLLLVRSGRWYGPTVRSPLVDGIFRSALAWKTVRTPGRLEASYPWTYVQDAARAAIGVLEVIGERGGETGEKAIPQVIEVDVGTEAPFTQGEFVRTIGEEAIRLTMPPNAATEGPAVTEGAGVGCWSG